MVRAELFLWSFSEETGMSDNLPTKRNLLASAFSSCEMGSVSCDTDKDMCEHWTHCWRWLESRTAMPRKMRKQTWSSHTHFFMCLGNNIPVAYQCYVTQQYRLGPKRLVPRPGLYLMVIHCFFMENSKRGVFGDMHFITLGNHNAHCGLSSRKYAVCGL